MKTFRNFWPKEDQMIFGCLYTIESDKAVAPTLACRAISDAAHEAMHCKSASEVQLRPTRVYPAYKPSTA